MIKEKLKQRIKFCIVMTIVAIAVAFAAFTVVKYQVEGEKQVPFDVEKIIVISSASISDVVHESNEEPENPTVEEPTETVETEEQPTEEGNTEENVEEQAVEERYVWEKKVTQTNDICIVIGKNKQFEEDQLIKKVKIENIQILQSVKVGKIQVYMPNSLDDGMYKYINDYLVNSTLTYTGAASDNKKALQIGSKGGCVYISFANVGLDDYKSNEDQEIQQGAYILEKMNLTDDDLKFKVSFDLIIEVKNKSYKTTITLDFPVEGVVGQKETHTEITDFSKMIYRRI